MKKVKIRYTGSTQHSWLDIS